MKRLIHIVLAGVLLAASSSSHAWWDWNPWPVWTPMYWAEEFFDDGWGDGWGYGPYGYGGPWGYPGYGNGYPTYGSWGGYPGYGGWGGPYGGWW